MTAAADYASLLQSGNDLVAQAQAVATQDFAQARALWQQAGAFFAKAHQADPEQHAAALRLAQAWMAEAHALQKQGSANAAIMWTNAAAQCERAFDLQPDHAPTAMMAASCHAWAKNEEAAQAWMQLAKHLQQLGAEEASKN
ncbi:hypothetical protein [Comamonas endophytica]|uniref:Tetratricopeptide repeat protein n=1 Tax=Comamonas endophytica TaxID=2949090 RepID=A0ABY6G7F0_9BURK|nr:MULTISPECIES: hypothetical protein [unclassified Acidovorax]MCD2510981.1 hypothetical protein [Acidovorax sp. D4N7]UYG50389.1 hypothetical protein M9799_09765 [Acidovorax sp. 5MLIR]